MDDIKQTNRIRVLHSAALLSPPSGICTQMDWEKEAAIELGLNWGVKMYCPVNSNGQCNVAHYDQSINSKDLKNPIAKLFGWIKLRFNYHNWLLEQQDKIDVFLLRYYVHDPFQYYFAIKCRKPVYFVHHTLEVQELALSGTKSARLRSFLEELIGSSTIRRSTGVIAVTQEILNFQRERSKSFDKPNYIYPNGIFYKKCDFLDRRNGDIPELLFVANFAPWHGLDKLLTAVKSSESKFILHLVGEIPPSLTALTRDDRIQVHGSLTHAGITELSQQCWVGLASFALDRIGMNQACPLKVREYLMLGLPVYGDYFDIFDEKFPFYQKGSEEIEKIIDFANRTRSSSRQDIADRAKPYIDKKELVSHLYEWISLR